MIPWVVARELRATLLDYLRSTWSLSDRKLEAALFSFLSGPQGMFQGPYLRVGLPFAPAPEGAHVPLEVAPSYRAHLHQLSAWQRLSSRGQEPRATLITTGTGSGKTECFLFPLLDHAVREVQAGRVGIKAIVLYPMNALASDQAGRFADTIFRDERLRGRVKVGLFVGGKGQHRTMGPSHVIDDSDHLRAHPPDILLTNYRMLDLLLQRPKDARLWGENRPETLRYLVLDELHTYDGAQGTDVACLIRRLGHRLGAPERICAVGTSATVGAGLESRAELLRFARTLFDQPFEDDAFIGETRLEPSEIEAASETIRALLESLALPCTVDSVRSRVGSITERFGARIAAELWADVEDILQIDQKDGKAIVAAIGSTRRAEVLAILRSSDRPLSLDELTERMGRRVRLPDEIIYFKRGSIGLKEHFPDFDGWAARLVPKAEAIVREQDADRQWSCAELLDELREQEDIPDWLTPWGLAALVRAGSKLQYLGRLRVALPGNPENDSRILVHDELERLLTETGGPMTREELTARILERLAVTELGLQQVFGRPQFVRLDGQRYGLLERDVPGGPGAVADALDHVEGVLARRNRGMSVHHIHSEVMTLSEAHAEWTEELVHSLLRADGRFRTVVGGGVGLSEWESTRFPTRLELVRSALEDSDGRVSVDALMERIKANYGEPPTRASLAGVAMKLGASLEGEWMVRRGPIG